MQNTTSSTAVTCLPKFIVGNWSHLFEGDKSERMTRIVLDVETRKLVRLDVQANRAFEDSYRDCSRDELADVEDSLVNANGELFDNPNDFGLYAFDALPDWATGGFQQGEVVFYKPDPSSYGPIKVIEVGGRIEGFSAFRDMTLPFYTGDLFSAEALAQELESLIFSPGDVLYQREKIKARIAVLKAAAELAVK